MTKYVDEKAVVAEHNRFIGYFDDDMIARLNIAIRRIPAADVVEVVRCKDCVWYVKSEGVCTMVSSRGEPGVPIQCYCSHGVRRCKEGME